LAQEKRFDTAAFAQGARAIRRAAEWKGSAAHFLSIRVENAARGVQNDTD
jgi:hypothetical protein